MLAAASCTAPPSSPTAAARLLSRLSNNGAAFEGMLACKGLLQHLCLAVECPQCCLRWQPWLRSLTCRLLCALSYSSAGCCLMAKLAAKSEGQVTPARYPMMQACFATERCRSIAVAQRAWGCAGCMAATECRSNLKCCLSKQPPEVCKPSHASLPLCPCPPNFP